MITRQRRETEETAAMRQAIGWRDRLDNEEAIEQYWTEFEAWLEQSAQHREAYHRAEQAGCDAELYYKVLRTAGYDEERLMKELRWTPWPTSRWVAIPAACAAVVIAVILAVHAYTAHFPWRSYVTRQEVRSFALEGSVVELDANTAVRVRFTPLRRNIELEQGRALFKPRHERLRAFQVSVNQEVVSATGTAFTVERKSAEKSETMVTEGKVEVFKKNGFPLIHAAHIVPAGALIQMGPNGPHVEPVTPKEQEDRLAWRTGLLVFNETLAEAADEFNRYNSRKLIIDDPELRTEPVSGRYNARHPDDFAQDLETSHHIGHVFMGTPGPDVGEIHLVRAGSLASEPR